jgi:hypothetical protein
MVVAADFTQVVVVAPGVVHNKVVVAAHLTAHRLVLLMKLAIPAEQPFRVLAE